MLVSYKDRDYRITPTGTEEFDTPDYVVPQLITHNYKELSV